MALGHHRRKHHGQQGGDADERLQQQQGLVRRFPGKGTEPTQGVPDRDPREQDGGRRRFTWTESKRRPHEDWNAQVVERVIFDFERSPAAEHHLANDNETEKQAGSLTNLRSLPAHAGIREPQHEQRGHLESAHRIPEPPGQPDSAKVGPVGEAAQ